jgi:hypothetical protein
MSDPGVIDEGMQHPKFSFRPPDRGFDRGFISDVGPVKSDRSQGLKLRFCFSSRLFVFLGDDNRHALFKETLGDPLSDPLAATGDNGHLLLKTQ